VDSDPIDRLRRIGFSEVEARVYVALLKEHPVTGDRLAKLSGIPRSDVCQATGSLAGRGAMVALPAGRATRYAPVPVAEFLDRVLHEQAELIASLKSDLSILCSGLDLSGVWNIEGQANVMTRAQSIIGKASSRVYVASLPDIVLSLKPLLEDAVARGVQVVVYTTGHVDLPGGRVVVTPVSEENLEQGMGLGLILIRDGQEALIGEWLSSARAHATWTHSPTLVAIAEHHLVRGGRRRFLRSEGATE
jgi:sugar-specific transcriptional regulator TrmB